MGWGFILVIGAWTALGIAAVMSAYVLYVSLFSCRALSHVCIVASAHASAVKLSSTPLGLYSASAALSCTSTVAGSPAKIAPAAVATSSSGL